MKVIMTVAIVIIVIAIIVIIIIIISSSSIVISQAKAQRAALAIAHEESEGAVDALQRRLDTALAGGGQGESLV